MEERLIVQSVERFGGENRARFAVSDRLVRGDSDRATIAGWSRGSAERKNARLEHPFARHLAGFFAGPKSPVPQRQAIEFARDFGMKKFRVQTGGMSR